jgi:hypothetical protein
MTEFEKCAREYCDVKVRQVDLKRLIRLSPCSVEGEPKIYEYGTHPPCWVEIDEGAICLDEACENCQATYPLAQERRRLGVKLPNLAKKMYATYREEVCP